MGRIANDGRGRMGGRAKGTPNKPQPNLSEWAEGLLSNHRRYIEAQLCTPGGAQILAAVILAAAVDRLTERLTAQGKQGINVSTDRA